MKKILLNPHDRAFVLNHANEDPILIAAAIHSSPVTVRKVIRSNIKGRLLQKVSVTSEGCWKWLGATNSRGYPVIREEGKMRSAAQVAYRLRHGTSPRCLRHVCRNPLCVCPEHMFISISPK